MRTLLKGFLADGKNSISRKSVLIENDRIIAVENDICGSCAADRKYIFKDEIISPGFIDVHGHSDISIIAAPEGESKRRQGVTCEICGNCGLSPFPVTEYNREHLEHLYKNYNIGIHWSDLKEYRDFLKQKHVKLRIFSMCGHNTLRAAAAGYEKKNLTANEFEQMKNMLDSALISGAPGMSTGLLYTPGCFACEDELVSLMAVIQQHNAVYSTHLKSEGNYLIKSLKQTFICAKHAGLKKVQISHLKTAGKDNWHKLDDAFKIIEEFRNDGIDIRFDRYPYIESMTMLSVILPPPYDTMTDTKITIAMRNPEIRENLKNFLSQKTAAQWERWRITGTTHPYWKQFAGYKYSDLPSSPGNAVIEQLAHDATTATIGAAGMSEENLSRILSSPLCMPGSDGNALPADEKFGRAHPRAFGAIAKFIRMKLDAGESIENVIKAAAYSPAIFFNLPDIGYVQRGKKADITVFSPDNIDSKADFADPHRFAEGIIMTAVNGQIEFY